MQLKLVFKYICGDFDYVYEGSDRQVRLCFNLDYLFMNIGVI